MTENEKLDLLLCKMDSLMTNVGSMREDIDSLKGDVSVLKQDNIYLKQSMREMQLTLENRLWPSIQRVAEGDLDLSRQLREALKPNQEFEMLSVRMAILETEVRALKQKMA